MSFGNVASAGDSLKRGLVGWYRMLGGVTDSSGRGNNGTTHGSPTLASDKYGNSNAAYSFVATSSQYISLPTGSGLPINIGNGAVCSVAMWFDCGAQASIGALYAEGNTTEWNSCWNFNVYSANNHLGLFWYTLDATYIQANTTGTKTVNDSTWHHVAWTNDGAGNAHMYVDGATDACSNGSWNYTPHTQGTITTSSIGALTRPNTGSFFTGTISDVRLYNRVLTAAEVHTLYAATQRI